MTAHAKIRMDGKSRRTSAFGERNMKTGAFVQSEKKHALFVPAKAMDESLEDARLNAIADERANGPFVQVSLDDL